MLNAISILLLQSTWKIFRCYCCFFSFRFVSLPFSWCSFFYLFISLCLCPRRWKLYKLNTKKKKKRRQMLFKKSICLNCGTVGSLWWHWLWWNVRYLDAQKQLNLTKTGGRERKRIGIRVLEAKMSTAKRLK